MKYRKRPVVIDAIQFDGSDLSVMNIRTLVGGSATAKTIDHRDNLLFIPTLEGLMRADVGDWIIRGVKGEIYPCKPDIFAATYEAVE